LSMSQKIRKMKAETTILAFLFLLMSIGSVSAQQPSENDHYFVKKGKLGSDTVALPTIELDEVNVFTQRTFESRLKEAQYNSLKRKVNKVYPYAKQAAEILNDIDENLYEIDRRRQEKKYLKAKENALRDAFEDQLHNLTKSEGKILFKLISRETGKNTYTIIRELKNPLTATWWQMMARFWKYNLKENYDPAANPDIESIVRSIEGSDQLPPIQ